MNEKNLELKIRELRKKTKSVMYSQYFNLFMNSYRFKELNYKQNDYIFRKLWANGRIASFKWKNATTLFSDYDVFGFADFTGTSWDAYDWESEVNLLNPRASTLNILPTGKIEVDKDCVIGYCNRGKHSVHFIVEYYVEKMVDLEMLINTQMKIHKMPFFIKVSQENKQRVKQLVEQLLNDIPVLFGDFTEPQMIDAITTNAQYIIDKLLQARKFYENELLTYLGINNLGESEKKEHLVNAEISSNNMLIKENADVFVECMNEFTERFTKLFNKPLTLECKIDEYLAMMEEEESDEDDEESEDGKEEE